MTIAAGVCVCIWYCAYIGCKDLSHSQTVLMVFRSFHLPFFSRSLKATKLKSAGDNSDGVTIPEIKCAPCLFALSPTPIVCSLCSVCNGSVMSFFNERRTHQRNRFLINKMNLCYCAVWLSFVVSVSNQPSRNKPNHNALIISNIC